MRLRAVGRVHAYLAPIAKDAGIELHLSDPDVHLEGLRSVVEQTRSVLVVSDDPNGLSLCAAVKATCPAARVLIAADRCEPAVVQAGLAASADGFLDPSITAADLVEAMTRVAAGHMWVPPHLLGTLLRTLVSLRREEDDVLRRVAALTAREREVLALVAAGATATAIAQDLYVSVHTARTHIQRVLRKLGVHSRAAAADLAESYGLIERFGLGTDLRNPA